METRRAVTVEDAIAFAALAHRGQRYLSPEGEPYVFHPLRVMMAFHDATDRMIAVLHDVIEDTAVSLEDLRDAGYSDAVLSALDSLTRRDVEDYDEYIKRVSLDPRATRIKLEDLAENLANNERSPETEGNSQRILRYRAAIARLRA